MVNELRAAAGKAPIGIDPADAGESYYAEQPDWFDPARVVATIEDMNIDPDVMPLNPLIRRASKLAAGEIVELVTDYLPAPGMDLMIGKGYLAWSVERDGVTSTYFTKRAPTP